MQKLEQLLSLDRPLDILLFSKIQRHTNAAKASSSTLPDRPSGSSQNSLQPGEVDEWWLSVTDPAPVPPLFLQSPTELNKEHDWWPGTSKASNRVGEDFISGDYNNAQPVINNFYQSDPDFDVLEGNSRIKPDKSTSRREDVPKLFLDDLLEDEGDSRRKKAAVNIQRWFRGWKTRKQLSGQKTVKELLSHKKMEKEKEMFNDYTNMQTEVCLSGLKNIELQLALWNSSSQILFALGISLSYCDLVGRSDDLSGSLAVKHTRLKLKQLLGKKCTCPGQHFLQAPYDMVYGGSILCNILKSNLLFV